MVETDHYSYLIHGCVLEFCYPTKMPQVDMIDKLKKEHKSMSTVFQGTNSIFGQLDWETCKESVPACFQKVQELLLLIVDVPRWRCALFDITQIQPFPQYLKTS